MGNVNGEKFVTISNNANILTSDHCSLIFCLQYINITITVHPITVLLQTC